VVIDHRVAEIRKPRSQFRLSPVPAIANRYVPNRCKAGGREVKGFPEPLQSQGISVRQIGTLLSDADRPSRDKGIASYQQ
jgi:hypothetical protein